MVDFAKLLSMPRAPKRDHVYRCKLCGEIEIFSTELPMHMRKHWPLGRRCGGLTTYVQIDFDPEDEERYRSEMAAQTSPMRGGAA
jgi:hypothetical protein